MMVSEITTGDHSEGADGRQRPRLRAAQRVFAIAVAHEFPFESARQVEITRKRLPGIEGAISRLTVALGPARVLARIAAVLAGVRFARITRTTAEFSRVVVIAIA